MTDHECLMLTQVLLHQWLLGEVDTDMHGHLLLIIALLVPCSPEYSSTSGSLVRWIWTGSSEDSDTWRPRAKKVGKGLLGGRGGERWGVRA